MNEETKEELANNYRYSKWKTGVSKLLVLGHLYD